jgi:hypothetical protein
VSRDRKSIDSGARGAPSPAALAAGADELFWPQPPQRHFIRRSVGCRPTPCTRPSRGSTPDGLEPRAALSIAQGDTPCVPRLPRVTRRPSRGYFRRQVRETRCHEAACLPISHRQLRPDADRHHICGQGLPGPLPRGQVVLPLFAVQRKESVEVAERTHAVGSTPVIGARKRRARLANCASRPRHSPWPYRSRQLQSRRSPWLRGRSLVVTETTRRRAE